MMPKRKDPDPNEVLATIDPHPVRRVFTTGVVGLLGFMLIYIAAATPPADIGWLAFLVILGLGSLYLSWRVWGATAVALELTRSALREVTGACFSCWTRWKASTARSLPSSPQVGSWCGSRPPPHAGVSMHRRYGGDPSGASRSAGPRPPAKPNPWPI